MRLVPAQFTVRAEMLVYRWFRDREDLPDTRQLAVVSCPKACRGQGGRTEPVDFGRRPKARPPGLRARIQKASLSAN